MTDSALEQWAAALADELEVPGYDTSGAELVTEGPTDEPTKEPTEEPTEDPTKDRVEDTAEPQDLEHGAD